MSAAILLLFTAFTQQPLRTTARAMQRMRHISHLSHVPKPRTSGFLTASIAAMILKNIEGIGIHEFTERDVVRHRLVQKIVEAYEAYESKEAPEKKQMQAEKKSLPKKYVRRN